MKAGRRAIRDTDGAFVPRSLSEHVLPKQRVEGSNPFSRSRPRVRKEARHWAGLFVSGGIWTICFPSREPILILKTTKVAPYQELPTIDYPESTSTPRFMMMRSEMSLSVLSKL